MVPKIFILALLAGSVVLGGACAAGPDPDTIEKQGKAELCSAVSSLGPRPSTDTTPVDFSLLGVRYCVPRNYIFQIQNPDREQQDFVSIKINLVDLSPLTDKNASCFANTSAPNWLRSPGCGPFTFAIYPAGPPADTTLANSMNVISNKEPIKGPFGFDLYGIGKGEPGVAMDGVEIYRKTEQDFVALYECKAMDNHGVRDGL